MATYNTLFDKKEIYLKNNSNGTILNLGNTTGNVTCSLCHLLVNVIDAEIQHGNHTIVKITEVKLSSTPWVNAEFVPIPVCLKMDVA